MAMYAKVHRMKLRDGLSISEIARRMSLSRNTIKTWLKEPVKAEMGYRRKAAPKKIDAFTAWLAKALETDALRLHEQIREQGFDGDYSRVTAVCPGLAGQRRHADRSGLRAAALSPGVKPSSLTGARTVL